MDLLCVDPGDEYSAALRMRDGVIIAYEKLSNWEFIRRLRIGDFGPNLGTTPRLVIEMIASYGMPVGREVFETCTWIGRFMEAWDGEHEWIYRKDVKRMLCGSMKATDANIRQALIDLYGPGKERAIGTKKSPGPLYGIKADVWSALAIAVAYPRLEAERAAEAQRTTKEARSA